MSALSAMPSSQPLALSALDEKIASAKQELQNVQEDRRRFQQKHRELLENLQRTNAVLARQLQKPPSRTSASYYLVAMESRYDAQDMPPPYVLKLQSRLLQLSHEMEGRNNCLAKQQLHNNQETAYLKCEISVMEDEKLRVETDFVNQSVVLDMEKQDMSHAFQEKVAVQQEILEKLRDALGVTPTETTMGGDGLSRKNKKFIGRSVSINVPGIHDDGDGMNNTSGDGTDSERQHRSDSDLGVDEPQIMPRHQNPMQRMFMKNVLNKSVARFMGKTDTDHGEEDGGKLSTSKQVGIGETPADVAKPLFGVRWNQLQPQKAAVGQEGEEEGRQGGRGKWRVTAGLAA